MKTQRRLFQSRAACGYLPVLALVAAVGIVRPADVHAQLPPAETLFVSVEAFPVPGGVPGNDITGTGSRLAPYREISRAMLDVIFRNTHVIFVGPSRGGFYSGQVSYPYNHVLKLVSEKGADSTFVTSSDGFSVVSISANSALQILEGFTIADKPGLLSCEGSCGGAINAYGRAWIINNKILRNAGDGEGGGGGINYYGVAGSTGIIAGNWIAGNSDPGASSGAGIQVDYSTSLSIVNNTIVSNTAPSGAGIFLSASAAGVTIANNIVAYNHTGYGIYQSTGPPTSVSYNLFYQNAGGDVFGLPAPDGTNITGAGANPLLADWTGGDYHLTCASPARDTGSNSLVPAEIISAGEFVWDLDGSPEARYFQTTIDIGGDEFWDTRKTADFDATPTVGCSTLVVSFANHSTCIDEEWVWDFGDGGTSTEKNPVHGYTAPGLYTVRLIANGSLDSDTLTRVGYIRVAPPLSVDFIADAVLGCNPLAVTFTALVDTTADSLLWSFGDGGSALGNPVTYVYSTTGRYTVELRGYNPCDSAVKSKPAFITIACKSDTNSDTIFVSVDGFGDGAPGSDITGTGDRLTPYRQLERAMQDVYTWNAHVIFVGPSRGSTYDGPSFVPYARTLKIVSEKGADSTVVTGTSGFSIFSLNADTAKQILEGFTISNNIVNSCEGGCAGGVSMYGRAWVINNKILGNVGDGDGGGINYYGVAGYGGVIAGNWIGENSDPATLSGGGIHVDYSTSLSIINNTITSNTAQTGAGIYLSASAAGVTIANNIIAYNQQGFGIFQEIVFSTKTPVLDPNPIVNYNLFYHNTAGHVANIPPPTSPNLVSVNPRLVDSIADCHLTCASPARNAGNYGYVPNELLISGDFDWDIDGPPLGRIPQDLKIDIGADEFWDTDKKADFYATVTSGCAPLTVTFVNRSTCIDEQWNWSFGDGQTANVKSPPPHVYNAAGLYTVRLIAEGDLDTDTLTRVGYIRVATPLTADFTADTLKACDSLTVTFTAQVSPEADSLRWTFGDGGTALGNPVTHTYVKTGSFDVTLRAYNPCGPYQVLRRGYINLSHRPNISITASSDTLPPPRCTPYTVRLHAISDQPVSRYQWDFGDNVTLDGTEANPTHVYEHAGFYSVQLIVTGDCGSVTEVRREFLSVYTRPTATLDARPRAVCASGQNITFTAIYDGVVDSSRWLFDDNGSAPGPDAVHGYLSHGVYQARLVLFHACGVDTLPLNPPITVSTVPQAGLSGTPLTGFEPLSTQFTDASLNSPTTWHWVFGDGSISTVQNPAHVYSPGVFDVVLKVSNVCGASLDSISKYILVGGFQPSLDSSGAHADTITYSVVVDSLYRKYDRPISLSGALTTVPRRGSARMVFSPATGTPNFAATMSLVPSGDLATGDYVIRLSATDPRITKTAERSLHFAGRRFVDARPDTVQFGKQVLGGPYSKQAFVYNRAPLGSGFKINFTVSDSGLGFTAQASIGVINPQESTSVQVSFTPTRRGDYLGTMFINSDDPAVPRYRIALRGWGTPELNLPRVSATVPPQAFGEIRIDSSVRFTFSEPVVAPSADSLVIVSARRFAREVPGHLTFSSGSSTRPWTWLVFSPDPCVWLPPDDTLNFRVRAVIVDTSDNHLDGNTNTSDEGSPVDDYLFSVATGPGVRPGDADQNRRVDERDILPLARFWGMTSQPRGNDCPGFTVQAASPWDPRAATHADADGNGVIDSADICPIAQYFDIVDLLPKSAVESWMAEAKNWDKVVIRSLIGGLINCPEASKGQEIMRRFLEGLQSQSAVPSEFSLAQNYPNPFNPTTVIEYTLKARTQVRLEVFDIVGRLVTVLEDGEQEPGRHSHIWDGNDAHGRSVASGIYFYRLVTPEFRMARKMVLMK